MQNSEYIFHGTNKTGLSGILQNGCRNSKSSSGWYGKGFYLTHLVDAAIYYSNLKSKNDAYKYIIVVDIIKTENDKKFIFDINTKQVDKRLYETFEYKQITHKLSSIKKSSKRFTVANEAVAEANLVIPKYVFKIKTEVDEKNHKSYRDFFLVFDTMVL